MRFEWDAGKAASNRRKHGVPFEEAEQVVRHPFAITVDDLTHSRTERRERTIGPSPRGRMLIVVHTRRAPDAIRIISARNASRQEVASYEDEIRQRLAEPGY